LKSIPTFEVSTGDILDCLRNLKEDNLVTKFSPQRSVFVYAANSTSWLSRLIDTKVGIKSLNSGSINKLNGILYAVNADAAIKHFSFYCNDIRLLKFIHRFIVAHGYPTEIAEDAIPSGIIEPLYIDLTMPLMSGEEGRRVIGIMLSLIKTTSSLFLESIQTKTYKCNIPGCKNNATFRYPKICLEHFQYVSDNAIAKLLETTAKIPTTEIGLTKRPLMEMLSAIAGKQIGKLTGDIIKSPTCVICGNSMIDWKWSYISYRICSDCGTLIDWKSVETDFNNEILDWDKFYENKKYKDYMHNGALCCI
jgi:hypothetical protein